jgi:hypothetical protein
MRRNLIDKITAVLPNCTIFKEKAIYPQRYFDDMVIEDKGIASKVASINTIDELKDLKAEVSKLKTSAGFFNVHEESGSSVFSPVVADQYQHMKTLAHSTTHGAPLNTGSILPELNNRRGKNPNYFMFGVNTKN